jgi:hypothetical protein
MSDRRTQHAAQTVVDNPHQWLTSDINNFTSTFLGLAFTFYSHCGPRQLWHPLYLPLHRSRHLCVVGGTAVSFVGKVRPSTSRTAIKLL